MLLRTATALASLLIGGTALAQTTSPYYLGAAQAWSHESNLFRLPDGSALPPSVTSRSDTVSTTSLLAGIDLPISRQRLYGSAALRHNRFSDNERFDNNSRSANIGLDWATIERLSGNLSYANSRSLRKFDPAELGGAGLERNLETVEQADATVRIGGVTRLTAEATLNHRSIDYSAAAYQPNAYRQDGGSIGLRYRPGGASTFGLAVRQTKGRFPNTGDRFDRRDVDLTTYWAPTGLTTVYGRLSHGKTEYEQFTERDFSGFSGALRVQWQPTGKLKFNLRAARDTGQDSNFITYGGELVFGTADFSRTTNSLRMDVNYEMTAKISLAAGLGQARRSLVNARTDPFGRVVATGSDRTNSANLGARWAPTRSVTVGCDVSRERRSASGSGSSPYRADVAGCFGQFLLH